MDTKEPIEGDMVICSDGRVGLLITLRSYPQRSAVTFGAAGPIRHFTNFRRADALDIINAGLVGVGCNQQDEVVRAVRAIGRRDY